MRSATPTLLVCLSLAPCLRAGELENIVRARLDALEAWSAVHAKHLPSGREIAVRADEPANTVSVIKLAVMVQAFREADAGRLDLEERHTIGPEELRRGTGVLQTFAPGLRPSWRDLVTQMITTSDNTATDIVIGRLGLERINSLLASLGCRETRLRMTIGQLFRGVWELLDAKNAALSDREVFERGFPETAPYFDYVKDPEKWFGRTTARETSRLLEALEKGELASAAATTEMRRILAEQVYSSRLPQRIRFRVRLAHKTGDWPPLLGNDVGVLYPASGPIVISVFTNANHGSFFELEAAIGRVAEDVLEAWGGED
jgi:beta-lactamase class A